VLSIFGGSVFIILCYYLFFYTKLAFYQEKPLVGRSSPGVSVVVAAWNELENLQKLIPVLLNQDYPEYEFIIVDDRSNDECYDFLLYESFKHPKMKLRRLNNTPDHITSKKFALTMGIKAAQYDVILLTDADCIPQSDLWIRQMTEQLADDKKVVLGYSPYQFEKGFLNFMIRYETFYTAVQYLSFAAARLPYMGVGRNLAYYKSLFIENKGYRTHLRVVGGDDDLFVGEVANRKNVAICIAPESTVVSIPKTTFAAWFRQKKRHLSVGKHYRLRNKVLLGLFSLSQIVFWVSFVTLIVLQAFVPYVIASFLLRYIVLTWLMHKIALRIDQTVRWYWIPAFDVLYIVYYVVIGFDALITKRTRWK
jgi:glycosyltransferase involved in cell wall biosynthesis